MNEPYAHECHSDWQFEQLLSRFCQTPGMYITPVNYDTMCAYLQGFDAARNGGPLLGFAQWLIVRANSGNNLHWRGLAKLQLVVELKDKNLPQGEQEVQALGRLLQIFFEERKQLGITKIYYEFGKWLLRKSWYDGPLRKRS
jgi:hypothetical protein